MAASEPIVQNNFSSIATDPLRNFKFLVDIYKEDKATHPHISDKLATMGFTSVSGLSVTTESIPYRQGGYNTTVHQIPGQTTFTPITLQHGVLMGADGAWQWMQQLFSTIAGEGYGNAGNNFRARVKIRVLDHPVTTHNGSTTGGARTPVKMVFNVHNAWITALSYSDLNAGDNALLVEQMTLVHEGFTMYMASAKAGDSTSK